MSSFICFLNYECSAIQAFIESGASLKEETTYIDAKIVEHIFQLPQLQEYFDAEVSFEFTNLSMNLNELSSETDGTNGNEKVDPNNPLMSWSRPVRLGILEHLMMFDIDVPWLMEVIESYRFEAEIDELVEIVRALDILGADRRLSEYEALLYMKLKERKKNKNEWERLCGDRLTVTFLDHVKKFTSFSLSKILGIVGSQRLIEYYLFGMDSSNNNSNSYSNNKLKDEIFLEICNNGHLSVAQWLHSFGNVNIHAKNDQAFRLACLDGHLSLAQWLYSLGNVDIHVENDQSFRSACYNGHLSFAQWLFSLGDVDIHAENDQAFRLASSNGHLSVAQWLFSLGDVNLDDIDNDFTFLDACWNGHLLTAQWLYSLGNVDIHVENDQAFRSACLYGHLSLAQWLYSLGNVDIHAKRDESFRGACYNNHLLVAQWLVSLGVINIHAENDEAFRSACSNGHLSVIQWLYSLGNVDIHGT